jgi:hypothetical protein
VPGRLGQVGSIEEGGQPGRLGEDLRVADLDLPDRQPAVIASTPAGVDLGQKYRAILGTMRWEWWT